MKLMRLMICFRGYCRVPHGKCEAMGDMKSAIGPTRRRDTVLARDRSRTCVEVSAADGEDTSEADDAGGSEMTIVPTFDITISQEPRLNITIIASSQKCGSLSKCFTDCWSSTGTTLTWTLLGVFFRNKGLRSQSISAEMASSSVVASFTDRTSEVPDGSGVRRFIAPMTCTTPAKMPMKAT